MSLYLVGAWGPLLQAAYVALGAAMAGLAIGVYRALSPPARSVAPLLLFVLGGLSLTTTAHAWMDLPGLDASMEGPRPRHQHAGCVPVRHQRARAAGAALPARRATVSR